MKVLVIGLDGATWDVILPLVKEGKLPTFKKLLKEGAWGTLRSTVPPLTGPAWLAMATGKTPGKTGVIDFFKKAHGEPKLLPITSHDYRANGSVWDILAREGLRVGVFAYPCLFPSYPINGFIVSGIPADLKDFPPYPESLKKEIDLTTVCYHDERYNDLALFVKDMHEHINKLEPTLVRITAKKWDFLFLVISATDWLQHRMWGHFNEDFAKLWSRIDAVIGKILSKVPKDTIVLFVSDHGFGPNTCRFNLAKWLLQKGYMKLKVRPLADRLKTTAFAFLRRAYRAVKPFAPLNLPAGLKQMGAKALSLTEQIDFEHSLAYCLPFTIPFGAVCINDKFSPLQKKIIKKKIAQDLQNLPKELGRPLEVSVFDPHRLYFGPKLDDLPDLIFTINDWACSILQNTHEGKLFEAKPFSPRHLGSHRLNGIFLAYGPSIKKGAKINAEIYDIAPTILHIFGLPIPKDMDGKVLMRIFEPNSKFAKRKPRYVDPNLL